MEREEQKKEVPEDNQNKWASIDLMIHYLITSGRNAETMCRKVFETPVTLSQKYDGTNVGKDEYGQLYGRNKMILQKETTYQKTDLKCVKEIDVGKLKMAFVMQVGVKAFMIKKFVVYGELMCNPGLYDYATNGVSNTFQLFGIMVQTDPELQDEIHEKIKIAGYTVLKKTEDSLLQICLNRTFHDLAQQLNYPTVPIVGEYKSFYDAVKANQNWMVEGKGEGLIVVDNERIKKWKIGAERNYSNVDLIDSALQQIQVDNNFYGEKTKQMLELLTILKEIQHSTKANGFDNPDEDYEIAIKSAMTKFDHYDKFDFEEYLELIAKECLEDIKIGVGKVQHDKHMKKVAAILKTQFRIKPKKEQKQVIQRIVDNRNAEEKKAQRLALKVQQEENNDAGMGGLFGDDDEY